MRLFIPQLVFHKAFLIGVALLLASDAGLFAQGLSTQLNWTNPLNTARTRHAMANYPSDIPISSAPPTSMFMVIGGADQNGQALNSMEVCNVQSYIYAPLNSPSPYSPSPDPTWTAGPPMPTARYGHQAFCHPNGLVYVMGGSNGSNYLNTVEIFNPLTNAWSTGTPMPHPRADFALIFISGRIYLIGGCDANGVTGRVESFDPSTNSWQSHPSLVWPRAGLVAYARGQNGIEVAGGTFFPSPPGQAPPSSSPFTEFWTIGSPNWSTGNLMEQARSYMIWNNASPFATDFRLIGGYGANGQISHEILHPAGPNSFFSWEIDGYICAFCPGGLYPIAEAGAVSGHLPDQGMLAITGGTLRNGNSDTIINLTMSLQTWVVLPHEALEMEASLGDEGVKLQGTVSEGTDWMQVWFERSVDGTSFFRVGDVMEFDADQIGAGWEGLDRLPVDQAHYRLVASKINGELAYSPEVIFKQALAFQVEVFPQPLTEQSQIHLSGLELGNIVQCTLWDVRGKEHFTHRFAWEGDQQIEWPPLSPGIYFLKVRSGLKEQVLQLLKH